MVLYQCTSPSPSMPYRSHLLLTLDHVFITPPGPHSKTLKKLSTKTAPTMPHKCSSEPFFKNLKNLSTEVFQRYHITAPSSPHSRNSTSSPQIKNYSNHALDMLLRAKLKKLKELFAKSTPTTPCNCFPDPHSRNSKKLSTKSAPEMFLQALIERIQKGFHWNYSNKCLTNVPPSPVSRTSR